MSIIKPAFPQVLLLGNGINRACDAISWDKILQKISSNPRVSEKTMRGTPYPLQAVLATDDQMNSAIKDNPELFCGLESVEKIRPYIETLLQIPFDYILTTNYSYEIERVADHTIMSDGQHCKKLMKHTGAVKQAEGKYLLHTFNEISWGEQKHKIWHIHGEARKPDSIILGHYYYGKLLGKYQKELEKRKNIQLIRQNDNQAPLILSWIDAFIIGDVYVLGYGYDLSEFDMWWLLNRKKVERANHGKLHFYSPFENNELVMGLIETYQGEVHELGFRGKSPNYTVFYKHAISDISQRVGEMKGV